MATQDTAHAADPHRLLFALGRPLAPIYGTIMRLRALLYARGILTGHRLPVPVISVGNLTLGGTGKTPTVLFLARELQRQGRHPAIISRGYGGRARNAVNVVSDGRRLLLDAALAGDEPRMLAERLPGVPVLTGVVRRLPALHAVRALDADILLLDDGFQHLAVRRDLDLVLFSADTLAGNSRVFPGGVLREPVNALKRCHAFVLTGCDDMNRERADRFAQLLRQRFSGRPVFFLERGRPVLLCDDPATGLHEEAAEDVRELRLVAFCGIARPESFFLSLQGLDLSPVHYQNFADHQRYDDRTWRQLRQRATSHDAQAFITTWKDFVKIRHLPRSLPLYVVALEQPEQPEFMHFVRQHLAMLPAVDHGKNDTAL